MSKPWILTLLAAAALAMGLLVLGAADLERPLPGGLPLGNAVTALALLCPAVVARAISRPFSHCRRLAQLALVAAVFWLPVSLLLAGNLALNFTGSRGLAWLA